MKTGSITTAAAVGILLVLSGFATFRLHAQGPLTPPGAPGPTMKTLDQVEPRTDLATVAGDASAMHVITRPGSYYLSGNLDVTATNGIEIESGGVTLDLMGFTIFRSSLADAVGTAISIDGSGIANVAISNGHISGGVTYDQNAVGDQFTGSGFDHGIRETASPNATNIRVSHVHVSGCDLSGIDLSPIQPEEATAVDHCSVRVVGAVGIQAADISHSFALDCGSIAILSRGNVTGCRGKSVSGGASIDGIFAWGNVADSWGESTGDAGIEAGQNVVNSYGRSEAGEGIRAGGNVSDTVGITTGTDSDSVGIYSEGSVLNSFGQSAGEDGIFARNVTNSCGVTTGSLSTADGISASFNVINSYGSTTSDDGIQGDNISNCYGITSGTGTSSDGIFASYNVTNSYGSSAGDDGIDTSYTISYSRGSSSGTGVGLECAIAVGCTSSGGQSITNKYLMP